MTQQRQSNSVRDPRVLNDLDPDTPISIEEIALFLGKSTRTINRYINKKILPRPIKVAGTQLAVFYAGEVRQAISNWRNQ